MSKTLSSSKANFGTLPVFLTAISTILGAVMFLRFGFAVGSVGFMGTLLIIFIGHLVTIPTAMALAEIATNQKVEGGGEYFIISRSFGVNIGAAIGIALYLSQAISVAFYVIAFAEAFEAIKPWVITEFGYEIYDNRLFSIPALLLLIWLNGYQRCRFRNESFICCGYYFSYFSSPVLLWVTTDYANVFDSSQLFKSVESDKWILLCFCYYFSCFYRYDSWCWFVW